MSKKRLCLTIILALVVIGFIICIITINNDSTHLKSKPNFVGVIKEINVSSILVAVNANEDERNTSDLISVGIDETLKKTLPTFKVGDTVQVFYDGILKETYPAKTNIIYTIQPYNQ